VNITGELRTWIEADLLQEHYNRWLEDMVKERSSDFDDNFYRHTLSPNVHHFLRIKEEIENAFSLTTRGKSHTSSHLRDELRLLLALFMEENIHLFFTGRALGHAAINQFNKGYWRLDSGKLDDFLSKSTTFADVIADIIQACQRAEDNTVPDREPQDRSSLARDDYINLSPLSTKVPLSHAVPNLVPFTHQHFHPHRKVHNLRMTTRMTIVMLISSWF